MKNLTHLISMREFVLLQAQYSKIDSVQRYIHCYDYAKFLSRPLTLEMFVACEKGVVLEEPQPRQVQIGFDEWDYQYDNDEVEAYKAAKERVLFEGFEFREWKDMVDDIDTTIKFGAVHIFWRDSNTKEWRLSKGLKTIEELVKYGPALTPTSNREIFGV